MGGAKVVNFGKMMEVMGVVIDSGFRQLGLLGEAAQQLRKGARRRTVPPPPGPAPAPRPAAPPRLPPDLRRPPHRRPVASSSRHHVGRQKERRSDRWTTASSAVSREA